MLSLTVLLSLLPLSLAALNGPCSIDGTPGVCIKTTDCAQADGSFRSNFCPNDPINVKCCIKPECGSGGNCRSTSTCKGTPKTNLCPGPANFQCCEPSKGGSPPAPGGGGATTADHSLSAKGVDFIAGFEGFRANFYNDAAVSFSLPHQPAREFADNGYIGCKNHRLRPRLPISIRPLRHNQSAHHRSRRQAPPQQRRGHLRKMRQRRRHSRRTFPFSPFFYSCIH